jgi:diguanylate cyclase (GGDEF)-like protein/PAS domain S-box-containing protein
MPTTLGPNVASESDLGNFEMVVTERVAGEEDDRGPVAPRLALTSLSREWMTRMLGVIRQIGATTGFQETLDGITAGVAEAFDFAAAAINVRTPTGDLRVESVVGPPGVKKLLGQVASRAQWETLLAACDEWGELRFLDHSTPDPSPEIDSWVSDGPVPERPGCWHPLDSLLIPLRDDDGDLLAVISVDEPRGGRLPDLEQRTLLELFGAEAALVVAEVLHRTTLTDRAHLFRAAFARAPVPMLITDADLALVGANDAFVRLLDLDVEVNQPRSFGDLVHPDDSAQIREAARTVLGDRVKHLSFEHRLLRPDGTVRWSRSALSCIESHLSGPQLVWTVDDVTEGRRVLDELRYLADHDLLTGLPNRRTAVRWLDRCLDQEDGDRGIAVLFADLDGFKAVNDRLGHPSGDELLARVAQRLATIVRPGDMLCRYGGDEFVLVCSGVEDGEAAKRIAARCVEAVGQPFALERGEADISVSIGIALARPGATTSAAVLDRADAALYRCKSAGNGRWQLNEG